MTTPAPELTGPQQRWVEYLESGRFSQTRSKLRDLKGHCCLGVGCQVAIDDGVPVHVRLVYRRVGLDYTETHYCYDGERALMPVAVRKHLGVKGAMGGYGNLRYLSDDNDINRHDFATIAKTIRSTPSLFV